MGFGYANLNLPVPVSQAANGTIQYSNNHSGFTSWMGFNFTKAIGLDYSLGYYSLSNNNYFFTNIFGAKLMVQTDKITPFVVAGLGPGSGLQGCSYSAFGSSCGTNLTTKVGGGID